MKTAAWGVFMVSVATLAACGGTAVTAGGSGGAGGGEATTTTTTTPTTSSVSPSGGSSTTNPSSGTTTTTGSTSTSTTGSTSTATSISSSGSSMANCGTFVFDSNAQCQACMTEQCCTELADCGPDCSALFDCLGTCQQNDMACSNKCITDHMAGFNPAKALVTCFQGGCENDMRCKTQQFPICDSGLSFSDPQFEACATCLGTNCCAEFKACANDADKSCLNCLNNPMGAGCSTDPEANAATTCLTTKCSKDCQ